MNHRKEMNTLIICCDQHNPQITGCYGDVTVHTPNLDALAARGTVFEQAYTATPLCVPARAAFATGDYAFKNGFWDNAHPFGGAIRCRGADALKKAAFPLQRSGSCTLRTTARTHFRISALP